MIVITGKSGVGKTTLLNKTRFNNIYFADDFVKNKLYKKNHPVFIFLTKKYPSIINNGEISIDKLRTILFQDAKKLEEINKLIYPYVASWLKSLPLKSIVEMATYIHLEKMYSKFFKKVVLITKKQADLSKFGFQPINDNEIYFDYLIENKTIQTSLKELNNILKTKEY